MDRGTSWATVHESHASVLYSVVSDSAMPPTEACQVPLSMGILRARILEWIAISFSRGSSQTTDQGSFLNYGVLRVAGFNPWVGKIPWRRERLPTPVFWPGEFRGL